MSPFSTLAAARCVRFFSKGPVRYVRGPLLAFSGVLLCLGAQAQVTVTTRQPARHAVAAPRSSAVGVGFSQAISAASATNLRVFSAQRGGRLAGSLSGGGTAALAFTPSQFLVPGDVLSVSLPASMLSTGGTALARQVYQFTAATGGGGRGFFGDTTVVGNTGNRDQVLGDLDGDGDLDLVTTGALYGCRVFLNNGTGRFTFATGVTAAQSPSGVALADVDADGDLDLLVGDADNGLVAVCINDGAANFIGSVTGAQNAPVGLRPVSLAVGDVDGDGDLDFATANNGGNSATVRFNNGSLPLLYTSASTVAVGAGPTAVALADIDNDGDLDLLTSNAGTSSSPAGTVSVCRNSGAGAFGAATTYVVGGQPSELALADVDGDGDLDLLTSNAGAASVSRLLNNGSGTFAALATINLPAGSTPTGLRTGDMDADGDLDLLVAQGSGSRVFTCLNTAGSFVVQARPLRLNRSGSATPVEAVGVTLGDVDGDGDLDLITSDGQGKVLASLNLGSLPALPTPTITGLSPASGPVGATVTIAGTALTDVAGVFFNGTPAPGFVLNGAGTGLDVTVPAGATTGAVTVVTEEAGTATSPASFTIVIPVPVLLTGIVPARNAIAVARTGTVAATFTVPVTTATASNLRVFGNLRRGRRPGTVAGGGTATLTFAPGQNFAPGELVSVSLPASLQAADGNRVSKQVVQFTAAVGGSGRHYFVGTSTLATAGATGFRVGDFDNDGDVDLVAPGGAPGILLQLNDGTGTFASATPLAGTGPASWVVAGDVDADGDLDLLSSATTTSGRVWLNNGSGAFAGGSTFSVAGTTNAIAGSLLALADADADGDLDLLLADDNQLLTLLNNGTGTFASPLVSATNTTSAEMTVGDVDGDGDLDVVVSGRDNNGSERLSVNLNNGAGSFAPAAALTQAANTVRKMTLADLDGDGDLDLALQSYPGYAYRLLVLRNNGAGAFTQTASLSLSGTGLAVGDTDADGDLDLVTSEGVALNNGTGQFALELAPASTTNSAHVVLADLDGDLDLDELCEDDYSTTVLVRLNRPGPLPTLAALRPASGPVGSPVLLMGTNLQTTTTVSFNGLATTIFTVLSPTQLVATVPAGATSGPVAATTPAGTATAPGPFTVTVPLAATLVSPARNTANAPRPSPVGVTFARAVSAASAGELRVFSDRRSGAAAGTATASGSIVTWAPAQPLAAGERLSVSVPDRLAGTDGSRAARQVFEFTMATGGTGTALFLPVSNGRPFAAYNSPAGFAVGDVDRDGDLDVLSNSGIVRFNDGEGAFPDSTVLSYGYFSGTTPRQVAMGDLDGDGYFDLLSTDGREYLNDQQGGFTSEPPLRGFDDDTRDLALGDLDADGDLDLVAPDYARDSVRVLFNDGTGHFPTRLRVAVGSRPTGISLGDVDNDGDLDFITANAGVSGGTSTLSVALNNGIGVFGSVQTTAAGTGLLQAALGDLDGDRDLDLVTSNGLVRFNNGTGTFGGSQITATGTAVALGDLDGDGDLDLLVSGPTTAAVRHNNGAGQFGGTESLSFGTGSQAHHPVLADLDGDHDLDLLVGDSTSATVRTWLNQRLAAPALLSFAPASGLPGTTVVVTGTDLVGTTAVAFNGLAAPGFSLRTASRLEVLVPAGATNGPLQVTNANSTATSATAFTVLQLIALTSSSPVANATVPRTAPVVVGFGQAIATNTSANVAVFSRQRGGRLAGTRTGAGSTTLTFAPTVPYVPGEEVSVSVPAYTTATSRVQKRTFQFRAAVGGTGRGFMTASALAQLGGGRQTLLGDVDGDGDQDAIVMNNNFTTIALQLADGTGAFDMPTPLFSSSLTDILNDATLGDVDGDGDLDLAIANSTTNRVHLLLNNGAGTFVAAPDIAVGDYPQQLVLADFDADGDLDLLTGNAGNAGMSTSLRQNDGSGSFSGSASEVLNTVSSALYHSLQVGDLDNDGDLDLVLDYGGDGYTRLNDGQGRFATGEVLTLNMDVTGRIMMADVDNDRDLDVLALSWYDITGQRDMSGRVWVNVSTNDGAGRFARGGFWAIEGGQGLGVGDVDADGASDVIVTSGYQQSGKEYRNDGQGSFSLAQTFPIAGNTYHPLFSDVDGDGDLDFVLANPALTVFFNGPLPLPVISSFTPASGAVGTPVVITGTAFASTTAVRFNGSSAPGFVINSDMQLTVSVPTGATTGLISVTTPSGTGTSATAFTVAPQVIATQLAPVANALSVARNAAVSITFPAAITAATAGNVRVFGNQLRGQRPGTLSGGGTATLSFAPSQDFAPGEQISVSLPRTIQATNGGVVRRQVYQFTAATGGVGGGGFRAGPNLPADLYTYAVATGDLDNDGDLDVLTSARTGNDFAVAVRLNNGQAGFSAGVRLITNSRTAVWHLKLGDLDGDGDLDVVASAGTLDPTVCFNNGNATFGPPQILANTFSDWTELGDVDADGDLDLVTVGNLALNVALNDGLGHFVAQPARINQTGTMVTLGDVDGDGDLDALITGGINGMRLFLNDGDGVYASSTGLATAQPAEAVALGDMDDDGNLDIVRAYNDPAGNGWLSRFSNDGGGRFTAAGAPMAVGRLVAQVLLADLDHDADLDLLALNTNSGNVSIRLNNGLGTFTGAQPVAVSPNPSRMALGDLDGDGDLDFAAVQGSNSSPAVDIRLNASQALATAAARADAPGVTLYPNPAHGHFALLVPQALRPAAPGPLQLYNSVGQLVLEQPFHLAADGELTVHVAHLLTGIYVLRLPLKNGVAIYKLVLD